MQSGLWTGTPDESHLHLRCCCGGSDKQRRAADAPTPVAPHPHLLGGGLSSDLLRTNKHKEKEDGGAIVQKTYFYQADDVAEYFLVRNTLPDLSVFFVHCGFVSPL